MAQPPGRAYQHGTSYNLAPSNITGCLNCAAFFDQNDILNIRDLDVLRNWESISKCSYCWPYWWISDLGIFYWFTRHNGKLDFFDFERSRLSIFQGYRALRRDWEEPRESFYWSAHFSFSSSRVLREVPYDPRLLMLFFGEVPSKLWVPQQNLQDLQMAGKFCLSSSSGFNLVSPPLGRSSMPPPSQIPQPQEILMTVRFFTHGWDLFSPSEGLVFHLWQRDYRRVYAEDMKVASWPRGQIWMSLLGLAGDGWIGLGIFFFREMMNDQALKIDISRYR